MEDNVLIIQASHNIISSLESQRKVKLDLYKRWVSKTSRYLRSSNNPLLFNRLVH